MSDQDRKSQRLTESEDEEESLTNSTSSERFKKSVCHMSTEINHKSKETAPEILVECWSDGFFRTHSRKS